MNDLIYFEDIVTQMHADIRAYIRVNRVDLSTDCEYHRLLGRLHAMYYLAKTCGFNIVRTTNEYGNTLYRLQKIDTMAEARKYIKPVLIGQRS